MSLSFKKGDFSIEMLEKLADEVLDKGELFD